MFTTTSRAVTQVLKHFDEIKMVFKIKQFEVLTAHPLGNTAFFIMPYYNIVSTSIEPL